MPTLPDVAVIMPALNEENHLESAVRAILNQTYSGNLRVVIALGPSTDASESIAKRLSGEDSRITLVANESGRTPDGLNAAISVTTEPIIVRVDAHSELSDDYISTAVETLARTGADNVGGIMAAVGVSKFEQAVAAAMTSKLGVGSAPFHVGGNEGPADSVYLGAFRRSALDRVGGYDPAFTRAQDWEMNFRIRSTGGVVWFNPKLVVTYRPRSTIRTLAKQYFQYGQWRHKVMREHPQTARSASALRYYAPPVATAGIFLGALVGVTGLSINNIAMSLALSVPISYLTFVLVSSALLAKSAKRGTRYLPAVLAAMQISWGCGFIFSPRK
jgi:glycosyltransferase involved in cell wall biosynthesis